MPTNSIIEANQSGRKLTLKDVYDNFGDYNFLIFTKQGTIDTSKFNAIEKHEETIMQESGRTTLVLYKVKPDAQYLKLQGLDMNQTPEYTTYSVENFIELKENTEHKELSRHSVKQYNTIDSIIIKSIRGEKGFLFNQLKIRKLN